MNLTQRQQRLGLVAIAFVGLWLGDRLVFSPLLAVWKERAAQLAELKNSVSQGALLLDRETRIRERWEEMQQGVLSGELSVAENQVLKAFDRWAQASRISINSIKPQWKQTTENYATLECRVDASGNLPALARFLFDLEEDPLALKVEAVDLTARDEAGEQLALGLQVSALFLNRLAQP